MLSMAEEAATLERTKNERVNKLITAQRKYARGTPNWQLLQDEIDNVSGRSVDRSAGTDPFSALGPGGGTGETEAIFNELAKGGTPPAVPTMPPAAPAARPAPRGPGLGAAVLGPQPNTAEVNAMIGKRVGSALTQDDSGAARLNQRVAASLQGISWEEWRRRNGLPPVTR